MGWTDGGRNYGWIGSGHCSLLMRSFVMAGLPQGGGSEVWLDSISAEPMLSVGM